MMNLEILKKEIELNARFNIVEYNIVSMRVFNLEVNIEQLGDKGAYFDRQSPEDLIKCLNRFEAESKEINYQYFLKVETFANSFNSLI